MDTEQVFLHCRKCFDEKPSEMCMNEYSKLSIFKSGPILSIWCIRHDMLVSAFKIDQEDDLVCKCQKCQKVAEKKEKKKPKKKSES